MDRHRARRRSDWLQLAYFGRSQAPVIMEVGPVLALEDVAGGKVCALASRVEVRDYADTARMLDRYSPEQLIGFARRLDPGLTAEDFVDAGRQLDHLADEEFSRYGLTQQDVVEMRAKFIIWPRAREPSNEAGAYERLACNAIHVVLVHDLQRADCA